LTIDLSEEGGGEEWTTIKETTRRTES